MYLATLLQAFRNLLDHELERHCSQAVHQGTGCTPRPGRRPRRCVEGQLPGVSGLGYEPDVMRLTGVSDAFVMPRAWEGLPIVLVDAASQALTGAG